MKKSIIWDVLVFAPSFTPMNIVFQYCSPLTMSNAYRKLEYKNIFRGLIYLEPPMADGGTRIRDGGTRINKGHTNINMKGVDQGIRRVGFSIIKKYTKTKQNSS